MPLSNQADVYSLPILSFLKYERQLKITVFKAVASSLVGPFWPDHFSEDDK